MVATEETAKAIYNAELKDLLERDFLGQYVAIVCETRRHYVKPTFIDAALAARESDPNYIPFVIRIGHDAAFHLGAIST